VSPFRARRVRRSLATLCLILAGRLTPNFAGAKPAGRLSPARVPHPGTSRNGAETRLRPAGTVFPVGASHCVLRPPLACKGANLIVSSRASYRLACSQPVCQAARRYNQPRRPRCLTTRLRPGFYAYPPGIPRSGDDGIASFHGGSKVLCRPPTPQSLRGTSQSSNSPSKAARPEGLPANRTAKSGSRDAPCGAELDLLAQIHVLVR
jgi:hypothetical protein